MVIVNDLKEELVSHIDSNLNIGELGTSNQTPTVDDTALIVGIPATDISVTSVQSGRQLTVTYNINSVVGNGVTYAEYGNFLTGDILVNRVAFTDIPKTSAIELQISTIIQVP